MKNKQKLLKYFIKRNSSNHNKKYNSDYVKGKRQISLHIKSLYSRIKKKEKKQKTSTNLWEACYYWGSVIIFHDINSDAN